MEEATMTTSELTGEEILKKLKKMGEHMTPEQERQQKISYIMGMLDSESAITRDYVEAKLEEMYGKPAST